MMNKKFSIILPVRNGGNYVKQCVQSILSQTLEDFNLIVLDNYSTDGTLEWIRSLSDSRITIYPSERSLTIEENWARATSVPKNEFITLIGHDDILYPDYLFVMNGLIQKHPHASLYQTHFSYIDERSNVIKKCMPMDEIQSAQEFLAFILANMIDIMGTGFMMRSKEYDDIGGIPPYPNLLFADFELWIGLTKKGYKATAPEECFAFRKHISTTSSSPDTKMQQAFFRFISYLGSLKKEDNSFATVIDNYGLIFLSIYCKGLAHRLLRTPFKKREGETVSAFLHKCKLLADELVPNKHFKPGKQFNIRLAKDIDSNKITRALFLLFKKVYSKPVYS